MPDLEHPKRWSEEQIERVINGIDEEINKEVNNLPGRDVGVRAGPDFRRLPPLPRLALMQQIDAVLKDHRENLRAYRLRSLAATGSAQEDEQIYWNY